ncbi:MAG TPA: Crp/Fnr family transcriptional regulator [Cyclobacteriaceae bacterium]|nr:Crp/Fnr family transcriptional regulator [Cyclobacteriaceae bacterium]
MDKKISRYYFNSKAVFKSLPEIDAALLRNNCKLRRVRKGKDLFSQGSFPRGVYILKGGRVKLYQRSADGTEQMVYIYTYGEMFGYRPLLCNSTHPASATTMEDCAIYFISAPHFLRVLAESAALSNLILQNLSHEFTILVNRIAAFSQRSAKERLALSLLILREKYRKPNGQHGDINMTRQDMASFVGTTNETLARLLTKLKSEGVIKTFGRRLQILNIKTLHSMMD